MLQALIIVEAGSLTKKLDHKNSVLANILLLMLILKKALINILFLTDLLHITLNFYSTFCSKCYFYFQDMVRFKGVVHPKNCALLYIIMQQEERTINYIEQAKDYFHEFH